MADWKDDLAVGDRVSFTYVDQVHTHTTHSELPVIDGTIVSLPVGQSPYFEIEVGTPPPEFFVSPHVYWSDEGEDFPALAHPDDLVALLPKSTSREDVEAWLA